LHLGRRHSRLVRRTWGRRAIVSATHAEAESHNEPNSSETLHHHRSLSSPQSEASADGTQMNVEFPQKKREPLLNG